MEGDIHKLNETNLISLSRVKFLKISLQDMADQSRHFTYVDYKEKVDLRTEVVGVLRK